MTRLKLETITLNYDMTGAGPAIVFINGLTMSLHGWVFQSEAFKRNYRVLRYDCRGQGESEKPDTPYSQEMHAEDLKSLLDKLDIAKVHIVGLSNGGMIAQHFTLMYPEMVGALVLVDTCSYVDTLLELMIQAWIKTSQSGGSELRYDVALPAIFSEHYIKNNLSNIQAMREISVKTNPPYAIINLARASLNHNTHDRISEIKSPTLIIVGEEDILIPLKYSKALNEKISGSKLVVLKGCGHVPPLEKPEEFNKTVLDFLKRHDRLI